MSSTLLIVNGRPGVGKSTLSKRLAADLQLPLMIKDTLKEFLFDELGYGTIAQSTLLGRASITMLYDLAAAYLQNGNSIMLENAFYKTYATKDLQALADKYDARIIEVYCSTSEQIRKQRFTDRILDGSRHPGHGEITDALEYMQNANLSEYDPLELGPVMQFDTTTYDDKAYNRLLKAIQSAML